MIFIVNVIFSSLSLDPWGTGHNGQQSIQTVDGQKVVQVNRNNPSGGNKYVRASGATDSPWSLCKSGTIYSIPNHGWVSMSYKVKGSGSIDSYLEGSYYNYGKPFKDLDGNDVTFAETVNFNNNINEFKVNGNFRDGEGIQLCMGKTGNVSYAYGYYTYNANRGTFIKNSGSTVTSGTKSTFNAGEKVLAVWNSDVNFIRRDIPNDGQWHTVSSNVYMDVDEADYSYSVKGGRPAVSTSTQDKLQIKDIKFGKASKVEVMRDDTSLVYSDYGADVIDSDIVVKPNKPTIQHLETLVDKVRFGYSAQNKQEVHNYKARSLGSSGNNPSSWSQNYPVTLNSTVDRYHIKLYKNGSLVKDEDTGTFFEYTDVRRGDRLTGELYTIDTQNQWAEATSIDYTVGQTAIDLKDDIRQFMSSVQDSNDIDNTVNQTSLMGLRENTNIPYQVQSVNIDKATKYNKGKLNADVSINNEVVPYSKDITNRPEYQTKEEFKSDVIDYVQRGNVTTEISYRDFQNIKETLEDELSNECKDNPNLNDVEVDIDGSPTEFKKGDVNVSVYYKSG